MKKLLALLLCIALLCCVPTVMAANAVPEEVLTSAQSVVRIIGEYEDGWSTGSGFVVQNDADGIYIATNYHVVEDDPMEIVVLIGEEEIVAEIKSYSEQKDLCILSLPYAPDVAALPLQTENAAQGSAIYAVGFPAAADTFSDVMPHSSESATITDGIVSAVRNTVASEYGTTVDLLQITAPINPGNSGGPLFNETGSVVGINTYSVEESQGIFGAICASELANFLQMNGITPLAPVESVEQAESAAPAKQTSHAWVYFAAGSVVLVLAAVLLTVALMKKKLRQMAPPIPLPHEEEENTTPIKPRKEKKPLSKKAKILAAVIAVVILLGGAAGGYFYIYNQAAAYAAAGEYAIAKDALIVPAFHDAKLSDYIDAGILMQDGQYAQAREAYEALGDYRDSANLALEARYQNAAMLINNSEYDAAIAEFTALAELNYADAAVQINLARYEQACYYLYVVEDFELAEKLLVEFSEEETRAIETYTLDLQYLDACKSLNDGNITATLDAFGALADFEPAKTKYDELAKPIYADAICAFHDADYVTASILFQKIPLYLDSSDYASIMSRNTAVDVLKMMLDREGVMEYLENTPVSLSLFLEGYWESENDYFELNTRELGYINASWSDLEIDTNIWDTGTHIELSYFEGFDVFCGALSHERHLLFSIEILDGDTINLYYPGKGTTTLYRQ